MAREPRIYAEHGPSDQGHIDLRISSSADAALWLESVHYASGDQKITLHLRHAEVRRLLSELENLMILNGDPR